MTSVTAPAGTRAAAAAWRGVVGVGLTGGAVVLYMALVGIVPNFGQKPLVRDVISLGQTALIVTGLVTGYVATTRAPAGAAARLLAGALAGLLAGVVLSILMLVSFAVPIRSFLPNASTSLFEILTFQGAPAGGDAWVPAVLGLALGAAGAGLALLPREPRRLVIANLAALVTVGLFSGLVRSPMLSGPLSGLARQLLASEGLTVAGAIVTVVLTTAVVLAWDRLSLRQRIRQMPPERRKAATIPVSALLLVAVLWLPLGMGASISLAIAYIALYILMGLGLNITLGLAGLLDLGFVAFFAVGAYTVGLLTSSGDYGIADWSFWAAVPVAILVSMGFGILLGLPILGIRGDYLAIATLGFGEIIAILARSDFLKAFLGGPRGITEIPKPIATATTDFLAGPNQVYYLALACAAVIAFVAYRLRGSRLGRAWIAIREDEDVAEALGVNLVQTKMLAYMLGAAFAGLGGAIFASLVGAVFPASINLFVSINVVAIVVVGGMGSIPGVVVGAIVLIGLPELFREFQEFRPLFYGIALMLMMRFRPEGLWPSRVGRREMHQSAEPAPGAAALPPDAGV
jgi:branched-chain amino acid transport system permease protein